MEPTTIRNQTDDQAADGDQRLGSRTSRRKLSESRRVNLPEIKLPVFNSIRENGENTPLTATSIGGMVNVENYSPEKSKVANVCIFLPDYTGMQFKVHKMANSVYLGYLVFGSLNIPVSLAMEMFAFWMCSPLIEIQLKPDHIPLQIRKIWPEILKRFLNCTEFERENDEPLLTVKRNVFLSRERELELLDIVGDKAMEILYLDARENVLNGRFLLPLETCRLLGAVNILIDNGFNANSDPQNSNEHNFLKLEDYVPEIYRNAVKPHLKIFGVPFSGCSKWHERFESDFRQEFSNKTTNQLRRYYLEKCICLPVYGSDFFAGQIERPGPFRVKDLPVTIAVNRNHICVVDPARYHCLLIAKLSECAWRVCNGLSRDPDCLPSLFLQVPVSQSQYKLVQIFTKQALRIETLLNSFKQLDQNSTNLIEPNSKTVELIQKLAHFEKNSDLILAENLYSSKLNKLCLATFDENGICREANGSLKLLLDVKK